MAETTKNTDSTETLWDVAAAAAFLRKSKRWVFNQLTLADDKPGSIPHVRLGRTPRFFPDDLRAWAEQNFPPAGTFRLWKEHDAKRARRNSPIQPVLTPIQKAAPREIAPPPVVTSQFLTPEAYSPVVLSFDVKSAGPNGRLEWYLTQKHVDDLQTEFPTVDVLKVCKQLHAKARTNPAFRKNYNVVWQKIQIAVARVKNNGTADREWGIEGESYFRAQPVRNG